MSLSKPALPQNCWHRVFPGEIAEISSAAGWVDSIALELALPPPQANAMQVCLEEIMSNIIFYGRSATPSPQPDLEDPLVISIAVEALADRIVMTFEDNGRPFDIETAPSKPIDRPLEKVQLGGLGIHLIKSYATNLQYARTETGNRVTLEFTA